MYVPMAQEPDGVTALNVRAVADRVDGPHGTPPLMAATSIQKALQQAAASRHPDSLDGSNRRGINRAIPF